MAFIAANGNARRDGREGDRRACEAMGGGECEEDDSWMSCRSPSCGVASVDLVACWRGGVREKQNKLRRLKSLEDFGAGKELLDSSHLLSSLVGVQDQGKNEASRSPAVRGIPSGVRYQCRRPTHMCVARPVGEDAKKGE